MPYFRAIVRPNGNIPSPRVQVPGYARMHKTHPATGAREFPAINKDINSGIRLVFNAGQLFIPDPDTMTPEDEKVYGYSKEVAKIMLDFASDRNNGRYGVLYEIDPSDLDGYWKKTGVLEVEKKQIEVVREAKKSAALKKIADEVKDSVKSRIEDSGATDSVIDKAISVLDNPPARRGRPPKLSNRPGVDYGAKSTGD